MVALGGVKSSGGGQPAKDIRPELVANGRQESKIVTFVDCTTVVDGDVCNIPHSKFCPFNIRGKNMCGECMYWKARIIERRKHEKDKEA